MSQVVQRSMKEARRKAEQMQLYLDEMKRVYEDILTFFGDDSRDENARREFFAKLANFVQEYKVSDSLLVLGRLVADSKRRNLTKRTLPSKKSGDATKRACGGSSN